MKFNEIEDAIISALGEAIPEAASVQTYAGQLAREVDALAIRFPAVFVAYGGSEFRWLDGRSFAETARFSVLCAARGLRGPQGSPREGSYELVSAIVGALANRTLGLDMEPLVPLGTSLVHAGGATTVYAVEFSATFDAAFGG